METKVGTCEWFFFVWIKSRMESAVRFVFESNLRIESAIYHASRNTACRPSVFCICDEQEWWWCTDYGTANWVLVYFDSVIKRAKQCCCTLILLPKSTFKRKFNHHQSFLYEWRLTAQTIRKFRIGPSMRIESRIGRMIQNRIESRSFAGP